MRKNSFLLFIIFCLSISPAAAQYDRPPNRGGFTKSLGQPESLKFHAGFQSGTYRATDDFSLTAEFNFGVYRDLMNPIMGILGASLEAYGGSRNTKSDGGGRFQIEIPVLFIAGGVDYNIRDDSFDFLFSLKLPLKRGGIFRRGTEIRINWLPSRGHTTNLGVKIPLWQPNKGRTRSLRGHAKIDEPDTIPIDYINSDPALNQALVNIRSGLGWIRRMTVPFFDQNGGNHQKAMAAFESDMLVLKSHINKKDDLFPDGYSVDAEIRFYHAELDRAFSIASEGRAMDVGESTDVGRLISGKAKQILLDEVIFPYNHLLGQEKRKDTIHGFSIYARGAFAKWLVTSAPVSVEDPILFVFDQILDFVEINKDAASKTWKDSRLSWLPLQYGLLPEDHDTQDELDRILERASGEQFSRGNDVWYVINEAFQVEVSRQILAARDYHVLWIHDVQGFNAKGDPDRISFAQMIESYYTAMTERIQDYDNTGVFPTYMIFLDQHYYEGNKGRFWMKQLEEPLSEKIRFSSDQAAMTVTLDSARTALQQAINNSELLQAEVREYGTDWLENLVKVHVNITNPADLSFRTGQLVPVLGLPDNAIRDHRKISFYDITEADPYRGMAIHTGMGIGEHYVGAGWEDRGLLSRGPATLGLKTAARNLLLNQGFEEDEIPTVLRAVPFPADYDQIIDKNIQRNHNRIDEDMRPFADDYRALEVHNETGFRPKNLTVLRAATYTLMPPGSVMKITDSLFNSPLWASMLYGSALRGARVFIIAPAMANAPSSSFMTMSREYEIFARLILAQNLFAGEITSAGGMLKTGLYNLDIDVRDIAGRAAIAADRLGTEPFLRELYHFDDSVIEALATMQDIIPAPVLAVAAGDDLDNIRPSLHLKAQYFASGPAWDKLMRQPEWKEMLEEYTRQLSEQLDYESTGDRSVKTFTENLNDVWRDLARKYFESLEPEEFKYIINYLHVGTANQDYRSMMLDGEVMVVVAGWNALHGLMDFIFLMGNSEWVDSEVELQQWLPKQSNFKRKIARWMKIML